MSDNTFDILKALVLQTCCKPGWRFFLDEEDGVLRLRIVVYATDARNPGLYLIVNHFFPVPTATFNEKSWRRWIFDQCLALENHEMGEWFMVGEERPFAPLHGPGENPYVVHEFRPESDAIIRQDGLGRDT